VIWSTSASESRYDGADPRPEERHRVTTSDDASPIEAERERALTVEELVRAATRLAMGSAGIAVASATSWQRGFGDRTSGGAAGAAGNLASAAMGLGLAAERVVVRGVSAVGNTAAAVTWGAMRAGPLRGPVERLADRFRGEQRLSEREVSDALDALMDAIGQAVLARIDIDRVIDRIALERVLARIDRAELARRIDVDLRELDTAP
jgi:hypothetical protein